MALLSIIHASRKLFPKEKSGGFTLLEVMISVALLAVGMVPLLVTHATTVRNLRRAKELTQAGLLAQSRIGTLESLGFMALSGDDASYETGMANAQEDEEHPFLKVKEEITEADSGALLQAEVEVSARFAAPAGEKGRPGVDIVSYIVNLYFEEEEEEEEDL
ncbi:MAG: prepilin-type N-terminal cleavage/methylation domain-containing protein [Candidatus Euphemobacter frigidus]|nr:prepilin-type N-terminal cleavage/methylation domain-containing protein [Candidatus Euphemobacter frigidus]MDP8276707.1 prepilin-type N-terminal cleavage/methylation domain-containing protein [Candidatus Euphemobacter frigidus]